MKSQKPKIEAYHTSALQRFLLNFQRAHPLKVNFRPRPPHIRFRLLDKLVKRFESATPSTKAFIIPAIIIVTVVASLAVYYLAKRSDERIKVDPKREVTLSRGKVLDGTIVKVEEDKVTFRSTSGKAYVISTSVINEYLGAAPKEEGPIIIQRTGSYIRVGDRIKANLNRKGQIVSAAVISQGGKK